MTNEEEQLQNEIIRITGTQLLPEPSISFFKQKLAAHIHDLINRDFEKLVNILYRLDINETKLKNLFASCPQADAGLLISELIIERQLEKMENRKQYKQRGSNISDEEKW